MKLFTATWCQPCQDLKNELTSRGLITAVTVVDVDSDPEAARDAGITNIPVLVTADNKHHIGKDAILHVLTK